MNHRERDQVQNNLIDRREFIRIIGMAALSASIPINSQRQTSDKPNIVLFFADDLGYNDLGCYGNTEVRTPHIDQLAAEGITLTDFYVTCSVCTPSRSGLLTGRYPQRNGLFALIRNNMVNYDHRYNELEYVISPEMSFGMDRREITMAQMFRDAGYINGIFGKWDSGRAHRYLPLQRGFDRFYGFTNTGIDYYTHQRYGIESLYDDNARIEEEGYTTDLFTREALRFIDEHTDNPFFLYVPYNAPHIASNLDGLRYQAPNSYVRMYGGEPPGTDEERYLGSVTCMDDGVGAILQQLEGHGLSENTLVIFTSDNGASGPGSNDPLRGTKGDMYEGGIRVPFIAKWPGNIPAGTTSHEVCSTLDLFPTLLDIAGIQSPPDVTLDGYNLLPVLTEGAKSPRTAHFWELRAKRAARVEHWKYVLNTDVKWSFPDQPPDESNAELYDLSTDVGEQHNLASERPDVLEQVQDQWRDWMRQMAQSEDRGPFDKRAYFDLLGFGPGTYKLPK